jgi:hypothetical protein
MRLLLKVRGARTHRESAFVLFLIVVVLVIGGMLYFLYRMRVAAEVEGEQFARDVIEHCAFQHDVKFLGSVMAANRRLAVPSAKDHEFIDMLTSLGIPITTINSLANSSSITTFCHLMARSRAYFAFQTAMGLFS